MFHLFETKHYKLPCLGIFLMLAGINTSMFFIVSEMFCLVSRKSLTWTNNISNILSDVQVLFSLWLFAISKFEEFFNDICF